MFHIQNNLAWVNVPKRAKLKTHWASRCISDFGKRDYQTFDSSRLDIGR
jgi:hypothetical protein